MKTVSIASIAVLILSTAGGVSCSPVAKSLPKSAFIAKKTTSTESTTDHPEPSPSATLPKVSEVVPTPTNTAENQKPIVSTAPAISPVPSQAPSPVLLSAKIVWDSIELLTPPSPTWLVNYSVQATGTLLATETYELSTEEILNLKEKGSVSFTIPTSWTLESVQFEYVVEGYSSEDELPDSIKALRTLQFQTKSTLSTSVDLQTASTDKKSTLVLMFKSTVTDTLKTLVGKKTKRIMLQFIKSEAAPVL